MYWKVYNLSVWLSVWALNHNTQRGDLLGDVTSHPGPAVTIHCFLYVSYNPLFSRNLFQINSKYSLDHVPDPSTFLSPIRWHLWPPGAKYVFACMCPSTLRFQPIFSKLAPRIHWTMLHTPVHFFTFYLLWWPPGGQMHFFCMCSITLSFQPIFPKLAPIIHWTKLQTQVHFCHPLMTFVTTRGPNAFFLVGALWPLFFNPSFPNLYQFNGPSFRPQFIFVTCKWHLWPLGGQMHFFLWVLFDPYFSTHLFQTCTNYSLDQASDPSSFLSPINDICDHQGAKCIFSCGFSLTLIFQPIFSKIVPINYWTKLQAPVYFSHP